MDESSSKLEGGLQATALAALLALIFVQLPVGVLIHTGPKPLADWLELVRFGFFLVAFAGSVVIFGARRKRALTP